MIQFTVRLLARRTLRGAALMVGMLMMVAGCGPSAPAPTSAPAATGSSPAAAAPAPKPAPSVTLVEPTDGAISGHIDLFRWTPVEGADAYVVRILGSDGRVVFESPVLTVAEAHLPKTVALEPEAHTWSVTARKGGEALVSSPVFKFTITP